MVRLPRQLVDFAQAGVHVPRTKGSFPTTHGGKAFDTALLLAWIQDDLEAGSEARICSENLFVAVPQCEVFLIKKLSDWDFCVVVLLGTT